MKNDELEERIKELEEKEKARRFWQKAKLYITLFTIGMIFLICAIGISRIG